MRKHILRTVVTTTFLIALSILGPTRSAHAVPSLQLDILGGTYDPVTETVIAPGSSFTLYALLVPDSNATLSDTYYISAAISPKIGPADVNLGSFDFASSPVQVTDDMVYGVPPLESFLSQQGQDPNDLGKHDVFPTFFKEFAFTFNSANKANEYNSAINTGSGPTVNPLGTMYFAAFTVDTSNLNHNFVLHFDLYNKKAGSTFSGDLDINSFAPFSHDAQSINNPEPGSLLLLGSGLAALGIIRRKKMKQA